MCNRTGSRMGTPNSVETHTHTVELAVTGSSKYIHAHTVELVLTGSGSIKQVHAVEFAMTVNTKHKHNIQSRTCCQ